MKKERKKRLTRIVTCPSPIMAASNLSFGNFGAATLCAPRDIRYETGKSAFEV